jgi:PhzF family phenazine biosynthesis protein
MAIPLLQVDAFADEPFAGNPAAVCLLEREADAAWMQRVAAEMNLSETAFLTPREDGYVLRWFTPTLEVDLCGHATLAGAHTLWERGIASPVTEIRFYTKSGILSARGADGWIWLDFPAQPTVPAAAPDGLLEALGAVPCVIECHGDQYLLELDSEAAVRRVQPDFALLRRVPISGVSVTSRAESGSYDFVSRYFAPARGIDEDLVTGSAHCRLAPYWHARLGKDECRAYQASARGGVVRTRMAGDRVLLGGKACTVLRGELAV